MSGVGEDGLPLRESEMSSVPPPIVPHASEIPRESIGMQFQSVEDFVPTPGKWIKGGLSMFGRNWQYFLGACSIVVIISALLVLLFILTVIPSLDVSTLFGHSSDDEVGDKKENEGTQFHFFAIAVVVMLVLKALICILTAGCYIFSFRVMDDSSRSFKVFLSGVKYLIPTIVVDLLEDASTFFVNILLGHSLISFVAVLYFNFCLSFSVPVIIHYRSRGVIKCMWHSITQQHKHLLWMLLFHSVLFVSGFLGMGFAVAVLPAIGVHMGIVLLFALLVVSCFIAVSATIRTVAYYDVFGLRYSELRERNDYLELANEDPESAEV